MLLEVMEETKKRKKRFNVRKREIMEGVNHQIQTDFHSSFVEKMKENNNYLECGNLKIFLAQEFGFCYGVERAIDIAYATRKAFPNRRVFIIGELIHNKQVNQQIADQNIIQLPWKELEAEKLGLNEEDVVIMPAFGTRKDFIQNLEEVRCQIIDATCGDVIKVWKRVEQYSNSNITSIIHGKADHEEVLATISNVREGSHYLIVLNPKETEILAEIITEKRSAEEFEENFSGRYSKGFNVKEHLAEVGIANQTTMLKEETQKIQKIVRDAIGERDQSTEKFHSFDTICGATQTRQDALFKLLEKPLDLLIVIGSYNSSNTSHLAEIGEKEIPTFFVQSEECLLNLEEILHFDLKEKKEVKSKELLLLKKDSPVQVGITSGASCPNILVEKVIRRILDFYKISPEEKL